eukprot:jgi/Bigna1/129789/aug1.9_g4497
MSTAIDPKHQVSRELLESFSLQGIIGEGAYGVVYKGECKKTKEVVAIKSMKPPREGFGIPMDAYREIKILKELQHKNIVRLIRAIMGADDTTTTTTTGKSESSVGKARTGLNLTVALVYSYAEHDLSQIIRHQLQAKRPFPKRMIKSFIFQILKGLDYLHQNWVMHRDIKPANILVMGQRREEGCVKIADFGLARIFQAPLRKLSYDGDVVTIWYRAPELLLGSQHYTPVIDIWSVGCIMGELMKRQPLFAGDDKKKTKNKPNFYYDQMDKITSVLGPVTTNRWPNVTQVF